MRRIKEPVAGASSGVGEASAALRIELQKEVVDFTKFAGGELPVVAPDWERIVERVYSVAPLRNFEILQQALRLGDRRTDRGAVVAAVDDAEDNARLAHVLYLNARVVRARWEAESEVVMSPIRSEANRELQREKAEGARNKTITDADVRSKMAALHPDEFLHYEERSAKLRGVEEHLGRFADLWQSRCASTRVLADKVR